VVTAALLSLFNCSADEPQENKHHLRKRDYTMTPRQKLLVQSTFKQISPIAGVAANLFYARLFELDPSLRRLFKGDLQEQGQRLMKMLSLAVKGLDHIHELVPAVRTLGKQYVEYGVHEHHYDTVGAALLWTLEYGLGPAFTAEVKDAWSTVYNLLSEAVQDVAMAA
jgi:hemoglobin-like flavoprotein